MTGTDADDGMGKNAMTQTIDNGKISVEDYDESESLYTCSECKQQAYGGENEIDHRRNCSLAPEDAWKLTEADENELFEAVCERYRMSYDLEDKQYMDYEPREDDAPYVFTVWVSKWSQYSTKAHKARARYDETESRWVIDTLGNSGWR